MLEDSSQKVRKNLQHDNFCALLHDFAYPKARYINMHVGGKEGLSVFKVDGWADYDIVGVGDKTGENTLSVT